MIWRLVFARAAILLSLILLPPVMPAQDDAESWPAFDVRLELGPAWFSRNDVQIPVDTGTRFDLLDLTGSGPDTYGRLYFTWSLNERHALRLNIAPFDTHGDGAFGQEVLFADELFAADAATRGEYRFHTYRLTYRWTFYRGEDWTMGFGGALLVRDAKIALQQGPLSASDDDTGLVPLLHAHVVRRLGNRTSLVLDLEAAAASEGRAVDATAQVQYELPSGWQFGGGYRALEGGAETEDIFAFALLHYAVASVGYRF